MSDFATMSKPVEGFEISHVTARWDAEIPESLLKFAREVAELAGQEDASTASEMTIGPFLGADGAPIVFLQLETDPGRLSILLHHRPPAPPPDDVRELSDRIGGTARLREELNLLAGGAPPTARFSVHVHVGSDIWSFPGVPADVPPLWSARIGKLAAGPVQLRSIGFQLDMGTEGLTAIDLSFSAKNSYYHVDVRGAGPMLVTDGWPPFVTRMTEHVAALFDKRGGDV